MHRLPAFATRKKQLRRPRLDPFEQTGIDLQTQPFRQGLRDQFGLVIASLSPTIRMEWYWDYGIDSPPPEPRIPQLARQTSAPAA